MPSGTDLCELVQSRGQLQKSILQLPLALGHWKAADRFLMRTMSAKTVLQWLLQWSSAWAECMPQIEYVLL